LLSDGEALSVIADAPREFGRLLSGRQGTERAADLSWDAREYVWHVSDNLRVWAERLVALADLDPGTRSPTLAVAPYDQDRLAEVRGYRHMPLSSALWALGQSSSQWAEVWPTVPPDGRLHHPESGVMEVGDVLRQVAHDTHHHQVDVERSLS
jgi:hypothetical protein